MDKGFTLIELIVSMLIIAILSTILFMGRGASEKRLYLQIAAFTLSQDLREAQEIAMGAGEISCGATKTFVAGVHFDQTLPIGSYLLFADCNGNKKWQSSDVSIRQVSLNKDVQVCSVSPVQSGLDVMFAPPEPLVYFNGALATGEAVITLCLKSQPSTQTQVKVNSSGRITIE